MTFEEYWYRCCDFHQCDECDVTVDCAVDKAIAQSAWAAAQLQSKDEIDALTKERNKWIKRCDTSVKKAWESAQPKWTYCKDGMPTEKDGKFEGTGIFNSSVFNVLHSNGTVASMYYYQKLKAFGTSDGVKVYSCNDVIAWMPLPEAPND